MRTRKLTILTAVGSGPELETRNQHGWLIGIAIGRQPRLRLAGPTRPISSETRVQEDRIGGWEELEIDIPLRPASRPTDETVVGGSHVTVSERNGETG